MTVGHAVIRFLRMNRSGLLVSGLVLVMTGCEVSVTFDRENRAAIEAHVLKLIEELQVKTGVDGTDERCPTGMRLGNSYTCQVRTVVGDQVVDVLLGVDDTANVSWRRALVGGSALAGLVAKLDDTSRHEFDCAGKVLIGDDAASVAVCPELRRKTAHIVIWSRGGGDFRASYFDDVAADVEEIVGSGIERIDCPDAETIRGLAPFECNVWRGGRLVAVQLTHTQTGWSAVTEDRGSVP